MGSEDNNKTMARRIYEEAFSKGNLAVVDEVCASNYVGYDPAEPPTHGPSGVKELITRYRAAFPDLRITVDELLATGDTVIARWTATGTNQGPFNGMPATGKKGTVTGIEVVHFANGKAVESFINWDTFGLMRQLGLIPEAAPATVTQTTQAQPRH